MAAQFTATKGAFDRLLLKWMACATSSLPVPLSPRRQPVAEVAAARRPAVLVPQRRPHDEQAATARVLATGGWPAVVEPALPADGWAERLERCASLDATTWARWCDGGAADRFADVVAGVAGVADSAGAGSVLERSAS